MKPKNQVKPTKELSVRIIVEKAKDGFIETVPSSEQ